MLINDADDVPEAVEEDEFKCFGSSCLERLKSHLCIVVFPVFGCFRFFYSLNFYFYNTINYVDYTKNNNLY